MIHASYSSIDEDEIFNHPPINSPPASVQRYLSHLRERVPHLTSDSPGGPIVDSPIGDGSVGDGAVDDRPAGSAPTMDVLFPASLQRNRRKRSIQGALRQQRGVLDGRMPDSDLLLPLPDAFFASQPLLYQLINAVVDDVPVLQGNAHIAALDTLATRSDEELDLRLRETLGLASYRLDGCLVERICIG